MILKTHQIKKRDKLLIEKYMDELEIGIQTMVEIDPKGERIKYFSFEVE